MKLLEQIENLSAEVCWPKVFQFILVFIYEFTYITNQIFVSYYQIYEEPTQTKLNCYVVMDIFYKL